MGSTSAANAQRTNVERVMGIEPTSSAWKAEVLPLNYTRADGAPLPAAPLSGPPSAPGWWRGKDSNLRRRKPADLQSAPVGRLGTPPQNEPRILILLRRGVNAFLARNLLAGPAWPAGRMGGRPSGVPLWMVKRPLNYPGNARWVQRFPAGRPPAAVRAWRRPPAGRSRG